MGNSRAVLFPRDKRKLSDMGGQIKLARLRRKLSMEQVSERANISRPTLLSIEKGNPSVSLGSYFLVLKVLGLEEDIFQLALKDPLGRKLQDAELKTGERAPKK